MVYRVTNYRCGKCRKRYQTYRDAENCEIGHIVTDSVDGFRAEMKRILESIKGE